MEMRTQNKACLLQAFFLALLPTETQEQRSLSCFACQESHLHSPPAAKQSSAMAEESKNKTKQKQCTFDEWMKPFPFQVDAEYEQPSCVHKSLKKLHFCFSFGFENCMQDLWPYMYPVTSTSVWDSMFIIFSTAPLSKPPRARIQYVPQNLHIGCITCLGGLCDADSIWMLGYLHIDTVQGSFRYSKCPRPTPQPQCPAVL